MMKKIIGRSLAALVALFLVSSAKADSGHITQDVYLPIAQPTAVSSTYSIRTDGINWASAQIVTTSATTPAQTFTDGQAATATITVASFAALSTTTASGQFTIVTSSMCSGVQGIANVLFASNVSGAQVAITGPPGALNYIIGGTVALDSVSSGTAANFATAVNKSSTTSGVIATQAGAQSTVVLTCVSSGTFCNAYAVTSNLTTAVSTAAFTGGVDPVKVSINGAYFQANTQFTVGASSAATANNLATAINASSNTILVVSTSPASCFGTPSCGVVYATTTATGLVANYALTTSNSLAISTSGPFMTGGQNNATITLTNGSQSVTLTANTPTSTNGFYPVTSNTQTATNIAAAILASSATTGVTATSAATVVYATATVNGTSGNSISVSVSTAGALTLSVLGSSSPATGAGSARLSGGTNSAYAINTSTIALGSTNVFGLGQAVYLSTPTGISLTPLVNGVTYYVITNSALGAGNVMLATSQANAATGQAVVITSSQTKAATDTFTLTGSTYTSRTDYNWVVSNDASHWLPLVTTPLGQTLPGTVSIPVGSYISTGTLTNYDFGHMDYGYLGVNLQAPTTGAVSIQVRIVGKE